MKTFGSLLLLAVCLAMDLTAQDISGAIEGSVLDPSGAAVPRARVTLTNTDRNQVVRTITTDAGGVYSAPLIPIGNYSIRVEAAGFKIHIRTEIVLNVNDDLKINLTMQVGAVTETVEVQESAVQVELGTPSSGTTIEGTQVRELALGTRNFAQLVALMPGVVSNAVDELYVGISGPSGTTMTTPFSVSGMRISSNNWTVDGADNVDRGSNLTLAYYPSIDAIAQFRVERSSYTADTGRAGGAQISVVTKSGSSRFHGSLYEFFRNDVLGANLWTNNANRVNLVNGVAKATPVRWNDFGGTFGGPVSFGHYNQDKNKTFFFYSEEVRRIVTYAIFNPTWATAGMMQGNFIQPVCITVPSGACPAGSAPVTQIPVNRFNANSAAYIKDIFSKLPLLDGATTAATTAGFFPERTILNSRQEILRIDQTFNQKLSLWGKFENDSIPTVEPGGFSGCNLSFPGACTTHTNVPGRAYVVHLVNAIRPTLLNDAGFNLTQSAILSTPEGLTAKKNAPDISPAEPFVNTQGVVPSLAFAGGTTLSGLGPYSVYGRNYAAFDSLTWIKGRHTLKAGLSVNRYHKSENSTSQQGTFNFTSAGAPAGTSGFQQSWANFLLGNVATFTMPSTSITPSVWAWQDEAYAQDDFKVTSRLTVYMGVRWSFFGQPTDARNLLTNFDPALYNRANAPTIDPATGNVIPGTGNNPTLNGIIIGGKGSPFGNKVGNDTYRNFAPRLGLAWDPFGTGRTAIRAGYGIYYDSTLFGSYEQNSFVDPPYVKSVTLSNGSFTNIGAGAQAVASAALGLHATQIPAHVPYSQQWNFSIQHQFANNIGVEAAYVGSKGTHLLGIVDINQAPTGLALAAGLHTTTAAAPKTTVFTTADDARINAVRPYYGWNYINALETAFDSNYHSLQMVFRKTFRGAGQFTAAYTWSKNLTDSGSDRSDAPQNSYNWHEGEYGPYPGDRQQVLTLNYVYTIPMFAHGRGPVAYALKGWEVSGIISAYTGQPLTISTSGVDPAGAGFLGFSSVSAPRPDMICDPRANHPAQYGGSAQSSAQGLTWFNTACFAAVPQGAVRPGNAGRGVIRGPGFFNADASLIKNFQVTERLKAQFRGEAFNILNWVNPSGFASTNTASTVFGQITSFRAARRVQLALKLTF
jgi:hypothetical protein